MSTKDEALFETLLLNKNISFSDVSSAVQAKGTYGGTQNFTMFREGVLKGPPFTQHLRDVRILQDGMLATVSLVFVNASAGGASWGWKSMQLLKVAGRWKIASEFYTGHGS